MKRTGLQFLKTEIKASDYLPKKIDLYDHSNIAVCDVKIKDYMCSNKRMDKAIEITFATDSENIKDLSQWNENNQCDLTFNDYYMIQLDTLTDEEIIKELIKAKKEGYLVIVK